MTTTISLMDSPNLLVGRRKISEVMEDINNDDDEDENIKNQM